MTLSTYPSGVHSQFGHSTKRPALNIRFILGHLVFALGLLPWVNFGTNELDTQPWTLIACFLYLATGPAMIVSRPVQQFVGLILLGLLTAVVIGPLDDPFLTVRGIAGHLCIALTMLVFFDFSSRFAFPIRSLLLINALYLGFAFLDRIDPSISAIISASRTTEDRGVTSLAAEPSFFAAVLFFLTWIHAAAKNYKFDRTLRIISVANVLALVMLAKSALGLILIATTGLAYLFYILTKLKLRYLVGFLGGILFFAVLSVPLAELIQGSRLYWIIDSIQNRSVSNFLLTDASANTRLQSIVFPIVGTIENFLIPGGFESYGETVKKLQWDYRVIFLVRGEGNIISSWVGALLYELGVFGLLALIVLLFAGTRMRMEFLTERVLLIAVCIHALPTNFPPIAILIVLLFRRSGSSSRGDRQVA